MSLSQFALATCILLSAEFVYAQSAVYSLGMSKCSAYTEAVEQARRGQETSKLMFINWTLGYMTADGMRLDKWYGDLTGADILLENYCRESPMDFFVKAVESITENLGSE